MLSVYNSTPGNNFKTETPDDKVTVTFFKGPASNTTPDNSDPIEWDELSQMLSEPKQGSKDGSYFVRAECDGKRSDNNTNPLSEILVIDADGGPDGDPCPPVNYTVQTLTDMDYQFILQTSYSNTPKEPKCRILFKLDRKVNQEDSKRLYKGMIDELSKNGIRIEKNSESSTWSQPFFLPRYKTEEQKKNFIHGEGGYNKLPVDKILDTVAEQKSVPKVELTQDQVLKLKKSIPPCIQFFCNDTELETTDSRNFNLIKMSLNAYSLSAGLDEDETISLCQAFINNYPFSNSLETPEARRSNFKKCYQSMKHSGGTFSCATVKALGAPIDFFNCMDCALKKPNAIRDVLEWVDDTKKEDILTGWIDKTKGMDAVSTDTILKAVSKKTYAGKRALRKDLKTQQKAWQSENSQKARANRKQKRKVAGLKEIIYQETATGIGVMQISEALMQLETVYRFGPSVVSIVNSRPESVKMVQLSQDSNSAYRPRPVMHQHTIETCRHDLEKVACCISFDNDKNPKERMFPALLIRGYLDAPNTNDKPLTGIVEYPFIDASYNPVTEQGYDHKTGLFISYSSDLLLNFNHNPSIDQSKDAYRYFRDEVLADFPFATDLDMVGAISIFLTALQRKMISGDSGCPGYEIDAGTQSTGKTSIAQTISYSIYNSPIAATSWSNNDEELGKHILAILREGHNCVLFDNLPEGTTLESNELSMAMTNSTYSKRLLGDNRTITVPSQILWLFTGNNILITGDFNTRIGQILLDAKMSNPDKRKFKRADLGKWCMDNRNKIIQACMTIILASKDFKCDLVPTRYKEWDKFVRIPLFQVTGIDVGELFERNKTADPKIEGQLMLLESWHEVFGNQSLTTKEVLNKISPIAAGSFNKDTPLGKFEDALKDMFFGNLPTTRGLGKKLSSFKNRIIGGYRVGSTIGTSREQSNKTCWQVTKVEMDV